MRVSLGQKLIGWVLLILTAFGFEIENAPLFLIAAVLLIAWVFAVLLRPQRD